MRKTIVPVTAEIPEIRAERRPWLDLEYIAHVELSSEDPEYPFENALKDTSLKSWKAATSGVQHIKLSFDKPQAVKRIHLQFLESSLERSQEIALYAWAEDQPRKELVRQQWAFSPNGSTSETEDYYFDLRRVRSIELRIDPGRHDQTAIATLQSIRIG
ncbi:hypothetical protein [Terriglobus albidus]|nr:hypothetical protein [Terriglobus albidus]